ncbi:MAG: TonB-dependent receptor domain-containing protein, partial [Candidatus Binatia bacterium]
LDGRLQFNAALYYYDYRNYQDSVMHWEETNTNFTLPNITLPDGSKLAAPQGRGPVSITVNIPKATNRGFEFDTEYLVTDALSVGANYSYTISEYKSSYSFFNQADPRYPRSVFSGGQLNDDPCTASADIKKLYCLEVNGYEVQGIPKNKLSMWSNYEWNLSMGTLTWTLAYAYTGEYSTNAFDRPWDYVPARNNFDTRVTLREGTNRWIVSVFVDNVLDKTYANTSDMHSRLTGYGSNYPHRVIAMYPRYIGMEMVYNFGAAAR